MKKTKNKIISIIGLSSIFFSSISCSNIVAINTKDSDSKESQKDNSAATTENNPNTSLNNVVDTKENKVEKNENTSSPNNIELELKSNNALLVAQDNFNFIKNRVTYFEEIKLNVPYFFFFQKRQGAEDLANPDESTKLDDIKMYIEKLGTITKDNFNSNDYTELVSLFDNVDNQVTKYDDANEKATVLFQSTPNDEEISQELVKQIESLQTRQYFMEKYNTKENVVNISKAYNAYWNIISKNYYKYPYLSIGSSATVNFKEKNNNLFTFSASSNKLSDEAKKAMANYVDEAISLLSENMSVYEKVFVLTRFVDDKLNYFFQSEGLNDAYINFRGVCKEYVEQAAILYSIAGLDFRVLTGEQHIWFTFKNEENKWFIVDPTHLDPSQVDFDYPPVFQGSAKLISRFNKMFKYERHLKWDDKINGLDTSLLDEVNNNITKEESESIFNNFIDANTESDYHFYKGKVYLVKEGKLVWFDTKNKQKNVMAISESNFENNNLQNLIISYKNFVYVIKNENNSQKLYSYNIQNNTFTFLKTLDSKVTNLEYLYKNGNIEVRADNNFTFEIKLPEESIDNMNSYQLKLKLKSYFVKFGLFFTSEDSNYNHIKEKMHSLELESDLNTESNKDILKEISQLIDNKASA
ncbi:hypothetical protein [Mesomycoplasma molare]|uniref:Transglutaminase-like domain-containing protein n=1 Tax=Mesomycoplasma molare TaxID=171288 RepID=A0ABY5TUR3_9BACT|nr:hypothetical protein [Mesomycoplasma molare]UWD34393.1 hypothetical protein NX772_01010 [Mesomycoplasma molare]